MKKYLLILLSVCVLAFCSGCDVPDRDDIYDDDIIDESENYDNDKDDLDEDDDKDLSDKLEDLTDKPEFDDDYFEDMGRSVKQMELEHGAITVSDWGNGPLYSYDNSQVWYGFSEYELNGNKYTPVGKCNTVYVPLYELIDMPDGKTIDTDTLVELSDSKLSRGYDDMDGMYYYEMTFKNFVITVYPDQNENVSADSSAMIKFK